MYIPRTFRNCTADLDRPISCRGTIDGRPSREFVYRGEKNPRSLYSSGRPKGYTWGGRAGPINQESLIILLLRERVKLLAYIRAIVRDDHLAEDIYQDVAVLAVRKRDEIRDGRHFLAWMRLTARHRALKLMRQNNHYILMDEVLLDRMEEIWAEHDPSPATDLVEALRHCLERLSPNARELVKLRYQDGISGSRLAEVVDRQLNTVYVALSRIHRSLGDCIRQRRALGRGNHG
jgi:RNA polymerase sigma-70 factor (ECF subfamily)